MSHKFNNNVDITNNSFHSKVDSIPDQLNEPSQHNEIDKTMDIGQEDLTKYKNDNFVESVGIEYQNLMNEMNQKGRLQSGVKPSPMSMESNQKKSILNKPTTIQISSNLDTLEQKIQELRQKRANDNRMMIEQQQRLTRKINKVVDHQKNRKIVEPDDIEDDVKMGIEARLNITTRKNLELKEQNKELNDVIFQKNSHIAKIMRRMRELEAQNDELTKKNEELEKLVDNQHNQLGDKEKNYGRPGGRQEGFNPKDAQFGQRVSIT